MKKSFSPERCDHVLEVLDSAARTIREIKGTIVSAKREMTDDETLGLIVTALGCLRLAEHVLLEPPT